MSLSCSDCFSDLLCGEASNIYFSGSTDYSPEYSSDLDSPPPNTDESIAGLLEDERDLPTISDHSNLQPIDASIRTESVAWILNVQRFHGFQPLTAYLSVNYFDRFLYSRRLQKMNGWPLQLLSVACLSLAAKMEEPLVPSLLDLQVEGAKLIFEPRTIQRMELLVLSVLDWRLRSISPFCYFHFFALKIDPSGTYTDFITTRAKEIIFLTIQESSFLERRPSCIAAASILIAANDLPKFSFITAQHAESWCDGLHKDGIITCQKMIQQIIFRTKSKTQQPKVLPQLQVVYRASIASSDSASSSSSSSSSYKRRKLSNDSWTNEERSVNEVISRVV